MNELLFAIVLAFFLVIVIVFVVWVVAMENRAKPPRPITPPRVATPPGQTRSNTTTGQAVLPQTRARLQCIEGPLAGKEFLLTITVETIGRAPDNRIVIDGILVSRHHAHIEQRGAQFVVVDPSSTNGTWINGHRVAEHLLQRGDRIEIGKSVFVFQVGAAVEPAPHISPPISAEPFRVPMTTTGRRGLGAYQLAETVGIGGAATVYKGYARDSQTPVAIKILHSRDPFVQQKFREEGVLAKQLAHPHIVEIFDFGEEGGYAYIVMEYIDGGSLRQRLKPGTPTPFEFTKLVIGQTCEALAYAHSRGVIHRDIKPENIMLSTHGGIKVVDFGIAKWTMATTKTSEGWVVGTPYYIPYELVAGDEVVPASDVYSLGIVLYEMLTGQWPFTDQVQQKVLTKHLTEIPTPPRMLNPRILPEIEHVALTAIEKNRSKRYQTTTDLAQALGYQPGSQLQAAPAPGLATMPPIPINHSQWSANPALQSPPAGAPYLMVIAGGVVGKKIALVQPSTTLKRSDVDPNDFSISREQHLSVIQEAGQFWVEDLNSTNGTFVNGTRIPRRLRVAIRLGDQIQIGRTKFVLQG